jgi:hypothetical protein
MKIWCLLSWYEEDPDWLAEMIESVAEFVDGVIAVDGPYPLASRAGFSDGEQYAAIEESCERLGLELHLHACAKPEVKKRAYMFKAALRVAEPMQDWFLIMDGDMYLDDPSWPERARFHLERTDKHSAEVTFHNLDPEIDGNPKKRAFRSLFRAIPGLTVEGSHSTYTVPDFEGERLLMWQGTATREAIPALDLTKHIHLYHRPHLRDPQRQALRAGYYDRRSSANIENVPDY